MSTRSRLVLLLLGVGCAVGFGLYYGTQATQADAPARATVPAVPVGAAAAARRDVPVYLSAIGTVHAYNTVAIRPQVDGQLVSVGFREGQEVHTGDILALIDRRAYKAALDQTVARKAQDQAQLANARLDLQRYAILTEKNFASRQQLDTTRAQVAQLEAAVQGDDAAIENALVNLDYTTIRSPLDGRTGIRQVDVGNIVHASTTAGIVVVTQTRPVALLFTLPEDVLPRIAAAVKRGPVPVVALSRDGKQQFDAGTLLLIDNEIDQTTGTIRLKATMPNDAGLLWPGQFVNARLLVETQPQAVTIPAAAVQSGPEGALAFVVKPDTTMEVRKLKVGETSGGWTVVESGIAEGETVVTSGHYRLQPGTRVEVRGAAVADARTRPDQQR